MHLSRRIALPAMVLLVLASASPAAANELANGSFENDLASWSPLGANLSVQAGGVQGSKYARAVRTTGIWFGLANATTGLADGQRVAARASFRAPRGKQVCVRVRERQGTAIVARAARCVSATGRWQRPAALAYTLRRGGSLVVVSVSQHRAPAGNRIDVDNVVLNKVVASGGVRARTVINTTRSWQCRGALRSFGPLPVKVVSRIPNPGTADAIRLIGCYGDGNPATVDLILDVRGNGGTLGTGYDAVKVGQSAHDLVVTGSVACGAPRGGIHQDGVQVMSGRRIQFRDFRSGVPSLGQWTCWGSGGGFFVSHVNGTVPADVVCVRCRIAAFNQSMRIQSAIRSGARNSVFGFSRSYGIFIAPAAVAPVNVNNRVIRY